MVENKQKEIVVDEFGMEIHFTYEDRFDPEALRASLGLGGSNALMLTPEDKGRIATRLYRNGYLSKEEVEVLGGEIIHEESAA